MNQLDRRQLRAVVDAVTEIVGEGVMAAYLYGSGALGLLRPCSDIDVFVILGRTTRRDERRSLVGRIMEVSGRRGTRIAGRPVEVTMACLSEVRPWRQDSHREFQYGEWLRKDYEAGFIPEPAVDRDLAPLIATLLSASQPLVGPSAELVLDPIPEHDLVSAMRGEVPQLLDDLAEDTVNVLLTLARIAFTIAQGSITTKDEAASWALLELPHDARDALAQARSVYLGETDPPLQGRVPDPERTAAQLVAQLIDPSPA